MAFRLSDFEALPLIYDLMVNEGLFMTAAQHSEAKDDVKRKFGSRPRPRTNPGGAPR